MNKYQRLVLTVAIINIIVMVMLPPFADRPLARGMLPSFDGFYPLFQKLGQQPLHRDLLTLQVMLVGANALAAWLVLQLFRKEDFQGYGYGRGIAAFAAANIIVMLLFPPFEQYNSMLKAGAPSFDSFYFIIGSRSARPIFTSLLYIEIIFVIINALAIFLLFNAVQRGEDVQRARLLDMAGALTPADMAKLSDTMRALIEEHRAQQTPGELGRKKDRRLYEDPGFPGPERRRSNRRNHR